MDRIDLGKRVKQLRLDAVLTLRGLSSRSGVSTSTLSKIENDQLSPTYDTLLKLAAGLGVNLAGLLSDEKSPPPRGRRSLTNRGEGKLYVNENYDYEVLCTELQAKVMQPIRARLKSSSPKQFGPLITHEGEELVFVLSGEVRLHTEFYEPLTLHPGDCVYYDSSMGHALLSVGSNEAEVFWVSTNKAMAPFAKEADGERAQKPRVRVQGDGALRPRRRRKPGLRNEVEDAAAAPGGRAV
jgi:transcriptional regulator with XRE-family HTH domain